ncbi:MAG: hypothetical protein IPO83_03105 [Chitinophagaceae bacterium]|nr:hypothetical protein [Chitinophagaceae bacterium]
MDTRLKIHYSFYYGVLLLAGITFFFYSCTKGPGEGGTSTIKGKIYIQDYNGAGQLQAEYYAPEERVYLIFGDDDFYGLDTRTSYDGTYEFKYLKKGSYTVFAYSDCDTCASSVTPASMQVEISENHATVELEDIILIK